MTAVVARVWGIGGVLLLLAQAVVRLAPRALEAVKSELDVVQWVALVLWCAFMAHAEGLRGFHRRFSPRVVARAWALAAAPTPLRVALAPAFCMSLFAASRRGRIVSWAIVVGVGVLVAIVSRFAQPWRGIVDAGVVLGLGIGAASIVLHTVRAMGGTPPPIDPDLPSAP